MAKLKVKHVGPIREGYVDHTGREQHIDFSQVTLFIGNQGSGKSTVAKLYSTFSWLEKALYIRRLQADHKKPNVFFKELLEYQRIEDYLKPDSHIDFIGEFYNFTYKNKEFKITPIKELPLILEYYPKVQYIPAERNFTSSLNDLEVINAYPPILHDFYTQYDRAGKNLNQDFTLPFVNLKARYDQNTNNLELCGEDYRIKLGKACSGHQSSVPLLLVVEYIYSEKVRTQSLTGYIKILEEEIDLAEKQHSILEKLSSRVELEKLVDDIDRLSKDKVLTFIIEELEQNLYPKSQRAVLYKLLEYVNKCKSQFVLTSHSPYLIGDLTLAVKAHELYQKGLTKASVLKVGSLVPRNSAIPSSTVHIYQLDENDGSIRLLEHQESLPSDENWLNQELAQFNDVLSDLLEIEYHGK